MLSLYFCHFCVEGLDFIICLRSWFTLFPYKGIIMTNPQRFWGLDASICWRKTFNWHCVVVRIFNYHLPARNVFSCRCMIAKCEFTAKFGSLHLSGLCMSSLVDLILWSMSKLSTIVLLYLQWLQSKYKQSRFSWIHKRTIMFAMCETKTLIQHKKIKLCFMADCWLCIMRQFVDVHILFFNFLILKWTSSVKSTPEWSIV